MAWTVRNSDGSLNFRSLGDVERAYRLGLVEPSDELREHGKEEWTRAGDHPALRHSAPAPSAALPRPLLWGSVLSVLLGLLALVLIARGQWAMGLAVALAVGLFLTRFTRRYAFPTRRYARS